MSLYDPIRTPQCSISFAGPNCGEVYNEVTQWARRNRPTPTPDQSKRSLAKSARRDITSVRKAITAPTLQTVAKIEPTIARIESKAEELALAGENVSARAILDELEEAILHESGLPKDEFLERVQEQVACCLRGIEAQKEVVKKQAALDEKQATLDEISQYYSNLVERISKVSIADVQKRTDALQATIDDLRLRNRELEDEIERTIQEKDVWQSEVYTMLDRVSELEGEVADLTVGNERLVEEIEAARSERDQLIEEVKALQRESQSNGDRIASMMEVERELRATIASLTQQKAEVDAIVQELESQASDLMREVERLQSAAVESESQAKSLTEESDRLLNQIEGLQSQVDKLTEENQQSRLETDSTRSSNLQLQEHVDQLRDRVLKLTSDVANRDGRIEKLTQALAAKSEGESESLQRQYQTVLLENARLLRLLDQIIKYAEQFGENTTIRAGSLADFFRKGTYEENPLRHGTQIGPRRTRGID